jgi:hypothetical protein
VEAARHLPGRLLRTAVRLEAADLAVVLAGAIEELMVVHDRALAGQDLAARADIDVPLVVVDEVRARERPIGSFGLIDRNPPLRAAAKKVDMDDLGGVALGSWRSMRRRSTTPCWRCYA